MTKGLITKSMLENLEYDQQSKDMASKSDVPAEAGQKINEQSTAVIVFAGSDMHAAAYHLTKSLEKPFAAGAIASVFVQEAVLQQFVDIIKTQLPQLTTETANHVGYKKALEALNRLKAKTLKNEKGDDLLVFDVTHEHLGAVASGLVTVHTFRTAKEAIGLLAKETLSFENATIWHENHSCAYELVAAAKCHNFYINCHQVDLTPLKTNANKGNYATLEKSYHYETLTLDGIQKNVVFPIGTIFAN